MNRSLELRSMLSMRSSTQVPYSQCDRQRAASNTCMCIALYNGLWSGMSRVLRTPTSVP